MIFSERDDNIFDKSSLIKPENIIYIWIFCIISSLAIFTLFTSWTFFKMDAIIIWAFSILSLVYLSKKKIQSLEKRERILFISLGIGLICLGVLNIPIGFGHPPFSIGDFSIVLSGISVVFFGYFKYKSPIYPVLFPSIAVIGFQLYEMFIENIKWLSFQIIPYITFLTVFFLRLLGIAVELDGNVIMLTSLNGESVNLMVTENCAGLWSLGTFTIATLIIIYSFPNSVTRKGILLIAVGYIGTFFSNIFRVLLIALVGYYFGSYSAISIAHDYFGWMILSIWLISFWYFFLKYAQRKEDKSIPVETLDNHEKKDHNN